MATTDASYRVNARIAPSRPSGVKANMRFSKIFAIMPVDCE
jgi:hypothetical protein